MNFKIYEPLRELYEIVGNLKAGGGSGGGGGMPTTGGVFVGDVAMQSPYKISQTEPPTQNADLVNVLYVKNTFLPLIGGTVSGQIKQALDPIANEDLANKAYVDSKILAKAGDDFFGIINFSTSQGDLVDINTARTGVAKIKDNAITTAKIQNGAVDVSKLTPVSTNSLLGTAKVAGGVTNVQVISVGAGLEMTPDGILSATASGLAGRDEKGVAIFSSSKGDLDDVDGARTGVAKIKDNAITTAKIQNGAVEYAKMQNASKSSLLGAVAPGAAVSEITVGSGLILENDAASIPTIRVDGLQLLATNEKAGLVHLGLDGDLILEPTSSGGVAVVKPQAISNAKMANMKYTSSFKGSSPASNQVEDIKVGSGLEISTSTAIPELEFRLKLVELTNSTEILNYFNIIYHVNPSHSDPLTNVILPPPANGTGQMIIIKKVDSNISQSVKIVGNNSSIKIDGNNQIYITTPRGVVGLYTDGKNYFTFTPRSGYYNLNNTPVTINTIDGLTDPTKNPTKNPNAIKDSVRYRTLRQDDSFEIAIDFIQEGAAGAAGEGDYLFSLPADLEFDSTLYNFYTDRVPNISMFETCTKIENMTCFVATNNVGGNDIITLPVIIIPYDKTQFRAYYGRDFVGSAFANLNEYVAYSFKFNIYRTTV